MAHEETSKTRLILSQLGARNSLSRPAIPFLVVQYQAGEGFHVGREKVEIATPND
jgi:hypothetical protein